MRIKIIIWSLLLIVLIGGILLWLVGGLAEKKREAERLDYYAQLIKEDRDLQSLITKNLAAKGVLLELSDIEDNLNRPHFTVADLNIIENSNDETLRQYGREMGQILNRYQAPRDNEIVLMLEAVRLSQPSLLTNLVKAKELNELVVNELRQVAIPKDAQVVHLRLLNNIHQLTINLDNMSAIFDEPILALESAEAYIKNYALFFQAVEGINVYFTKKGIMFNKDETAQIYDSIGIISDND
ncbi:MAG: hypothetical protein WDZ85_03210 [Candidatus Paceibacterota bacterium]